MIFQEFHLVHLSMTNISLLEEFQSRKADMLTEYVNCPRIFGYGIYEIHYEYSLRSNVVKTVFSFLVCLKIEFFETKFELLLVVMKTRWDNLKIESHKHIEFFNN